MAKYIGNSTIVEHKGLARLKMFCASNTPFLVCRDETITDVGIDGEIEICLKNEEGKTEATGERIKFQLKSTESNNSYIQEEDDFSFKFYANKEDILYWGKHKQEVLLIIYDVRTDKLYARKITLTDFLTQSQKKIKWPVTFNKQECLLSEDNFDFHKKYTLSIKHRLNYDLKEPAMTNLFRIRKFPKIIYSYSTIFSNKEAIYNSLPPETEIPTFVIYGKVIYTFVEPSNQSDYFRKHIVQVDTEMRNVFGASMDKNVRNHYVELIRVYLKGFLGSKGIYFNRDHNRFYFGIREGDAVRSIFTKTRKQNRKSPKEVAKFYTYGIYQFFRHTAFEIEFVHAESMYLCITPTYLVTEDGRKPIGGKIASKIIIRQKSVEFNPNVASLIHTIYSYLAGDSDFITVSNRDNIELEISSYIPQQLPFSISVDDKGFPNYLKKQKKMSMEHSVQRLF